MMRRTLQFGAVAGAVLLLNASCAPRTGIPVGLEMHSVGDLQVGVATLPDPPAVGENVMTVMVRDAQGKPVPGAKLETIISMPAMGAMPYMESRGVVRSVAAGTYEVKYGLAMAGDWTAELKLRPREGSALASRWKVSTNLKGVSFIEGASAHPGGGTRARDGADSSQAQVHEDSSSALAPPQEIVLDAERRQSLGIRVEPALQRDLTVEVHAAGRIAYDETRRVDVTARFSGFVRAIHADFAGQAVRRGEALFEIYSPEVWAAQQEFLQALAASREDSLRGGSNGADLAAAARKRLMLWELSATDIDAIARAGRARETLPVRAPSGGVITEKSVVLGSPVTAGQVVYRIAPTDPVWVLANVYEQDLPLLRLGAGVTLTQPDGAGSARQGRVSFIAPDLAADTRTGTVRIEVANADGGLKPGMFVDALMHVKLGRRLAIPESAVLPTGERRVVFVDLGGGRLAPREVTLGARAGEWIEVRAGLIGGERVVTSGNFLVAAESRLRSATGKW